MNQFKKGDKVKRVAGSHEGMVVGDTADVRYQEGGSHLYLEEYEGSHDPVNFELVQDEKESIKQFLKTQPWWIAVRDQEEYNNVQKWLEENYGSCCIANYSFGMKYLTNTPSVGHIENDWVMHGSDSKPTEQEIKLTFKTIVESVELPVVESKEEVERKKKIQELKETIALAQKQLEEMN